MSDPKTMNKSDLIEQLSSHFPHLPSKDIDMATKIALQHMVETLCKGDSVQIRGFGTFTLRYRQSKLVRNPKTGEQLMSGAKHTVHFKPGKELRERVDRSRIN